MRSRFVLIAILVLTALAYLATGWTVVAPGETAVVVRLGRVLPTRWMRGPHWGLPIGLDRVIRVRTEEVRRIDVGLAGLPSADDDPAAGEYITGDRNLLRARAVVQYRVADPVAFLIRSERIEPLLSLLAESSLSRAFAHQGIDRVLREGRTEVAHEVAVGLNQAATSYDLGIAILGVSLTDARPPIEVQPDFAAAQSARSDRERRVGEAKTYIATTLTAARAEAQFRANRAKAMADRSLALARSGAERFTSLLAEADRSRRLTVRRLYLDMLRDLMPRVRRKVLLTPDEPIDMSLFGDSRSQ
jgi:modulator of FtsH protease HflK